MCMITVNVVHAASGLTTDKQRMVSKWPHVYKINQRSKYFEIRQGTYRGQESKETFPETSKVFQFSHIKTAAHTHKTVYQTEEV